MNKFGLLSVEAYYKNVLHLQENKFTFQTIESSSVLKLLKNVKVNKAAGMDNISRGFLKDGADILAIPVTQTCNLSIKGATKLYFTMEMVLRIIHVWSLLFQYEFI